MRSPGWGGAVRRCCQRTARDRTCLWRSCGAAWSPARTPGSARCGRWTGAPQAHPAPARCCRCLRQRQRPPQQLPPLRQHGPLPTCRCLRRLQQHLQLRLPPRQSRRVQGGSAWRQPQQWDVRGHGQTRTYAAWGAPRDCSYEEAQQHAAQQWGLDQRPHALVLHTTYHLKTVINTSTVLV